VNNNEQSQNAVAVAKIFESTKMSEDRFGKLVPMFEQVGRLGNEAVTAFESIRILANHLERSRAFSSLSRAFRTNSRYWRARSTLLALCKVDSPRSRMRFMII
jgi:hypothetical protein